MEQEIINQKIEERKGDRTYSNIIVSLWRYGFENDDQTAVDVDDLQGVVAYVGKKLRDDVISEPNVSIHVQGKCEDLSDKYIYGKSETYQTDDRNGVCADGDPMSVRYKRIDTGKVFKMKTGKFFRRLIDEMHPELPEPVRVYFCEQLSAMYRAGHAEDGRYKLTLDRDFEKIYTGYYFGSCMADKGQWKFYRDSSPDALAAGLWDGDRLVARCIVWNATDADTGEKIRLAERQYGDNSETRRQLVYLLAEQHKIDGHKQFEAGCYDGRNYVMLDGKSLRDRHLYVTCTAREGDVQSFQDSFRYLSFGEERAYNWEDADYDVDIATTDRCIGGRCDDPEDGEIDGSQRYVERDNEWYNRDSTVYMDYRGEWAHEDDCYYSEQEDDNILCDDAVQLYDEEYCQRDNARLIEAGEHEGEYAYYEDDDLKRDYQGRYVLADDCEEIFAGRYAGSFVPKNEADELEPRFYGEDHFMPSDSDETTLTESYELILTDDSVELGGCVYHKSEVVKAMNRQLREFQWCLRDDCVEIRGTYYLMDVA